MHLSCPRCAQPLHPVSLGLVRSAGYREAVGADTEGFACGRCGVGVVPGRVVNELMRGVDVGGRMTERERTTTRLGCPTPNCFANLDRVTLSWEQDFVEIEQCARCSTMLLDPGEFTKVFLIERGGR
jgi:hypothetical protein